jgi:sulfur carrier protein ThiS
LKVEVHLLATLSRYLPPDSRESVILVELPGEVTAKDLVAHLGISDDLPAVMLVNGIDAVPSQRLNEGDVVTLFPPLSGGS